jgi:hypothetical protein
MTVEISKDRLGQSQRPKSVFGSVLEAKLALSVDPLGTVYRRAGSVYVVTASGSGTFTREEWERP